MAQLPSLEYLMTCSAQSLSDLELGALNRSANCLKRAKLEWDEALAQREVAGVARWFIEHRPALFEQVRQTIECQAAQGVLSFQLPELPESPFDEGLSIVGKSASHAMRKYSSR